MIENYGKLLRGQRSDQLSYVPRLFFNNLVIRHIESSVSQLSLFSLFSTISLLWTQFWASVDTTWTPRWTPKSPLQLQNKVYQMRRDLVSSLPSHLSKIFVPLVETRIQKSELSARCASARRAARHIQAAKLIC